MLQHERPRSSGLIYMNLNFNPRDNITAFERIAVPVLAPLTRINRLSIRRISVLLKTVKNWYDVVFFKLGLKKGEFTVHLRDGKDVAMANRGDYFSFWGIEEIQQELLRRHGLGAKIDAKGKTVEFTFMGHKVLFTYDSVKRLAEIDRLISDQFVEDGYKWLDAKGREVVDIGANLGDTAIYFALKEAKHVYAFEPYPYSFDYAIGNIKLNGLQDRVTILNEGCGGESRMVSVDREYQNTAQSSLTDSGKGQKVQVSSLGDIIRRFGIAHPAILKVDCEGCEYDVILKASDSDLGKFEQIQIEYHYGYLNLKNRLEKAGFKVKNTMPRASRNPDRESRNMFLGMIYAHKTQIAGSSHEQLGVPQEKQ